VTASVLEKLVSQIDQQGRFAVFDAFFSAVAGTIRVSIATLASDVKHILIVITNICELTRSADKVAMDGKLILLSLTTHEEPVKRVTSTARQLIGAPGARAILSTRR